MVRLEEETTEIVHVDQAASDRIITEVHKHCGDCGLCSIGRGESGYGAVISDGRVLNARGLSPDLSVCTINGKKIKVDLVAESLTLERRRI